MEGHIPYIHQSHFASLHSITYYCTPLFAYCHISFIPPLFAFGLRLMTAYTDWDLPANIRTEHVFTVTLRTCYYISEILVTLFYTRSFIDSTPFCLYTHVYPTYPLVLIPPVQCLFHYYCYFVLRYILLLPIPCTIFYTS